jgi:hypothetical protein
MGMTKDKSMFFASRHAIGSKEDVLFQGMMHDWWWSDYFKKGSHLK